MAVRDETTATGTTAIAGVRVINGSIVVELAGMAPFLDYFMVCIPSE